MNHEPRTTNHEQPDSVWLCLRSQPRRERLAAVSARSVEGVVDVFAPEVRVRRKTRRGAVWFVEALFPSYVFVRVNEMVQRRELASVRGAGGLVRFGDRVAEVRDEIIDSLRSVYAKKEFLEIDRPLEPGEEAEVVSGPFQGFMARVLRSPNGSQRVAVLVEMMGRQVEAALHRDQLEATEKDFSQHPLATASG